MSRSLLPFEAAFRQWTESHGGRWCPLRLTISPTGESTTAYRLSPPGQARRTVVTVHGAGNDALFGWVALFKRLLTDGTEILAFDLPGHGRGNATRFDADLAVAAVGAALTAAGTEGGSRPVHAVGVSLGGAVLLRSLASLGHRPTTAILLVTPLRIRATAASVLNEFRPRTFELLWREREHYGLGGLVPSFGPFKREVYPLRLTAAPRPGLLGYVQSLNDVLDEMHLEDAARAVPIPVLLIHGERDRVVPVEQAERLLTALPRGELMRVPRGTHLSTLIEPEVVGRVHDWMRAHE